MANKAYRRSTNCILSIISINGDFICIYTFQLISQLTISVILERLLPSRLVNLRDRFTLTCFVNCCSVNTNWLSIINTNSSSTKTSMSIVQLTFKPYVENIYYYLKWMSFSPTQYFMPYKPIETYIYSSVNGVDSCNECFISSHAFVPAKSGYDIYTGGR